MKTVTKMPSRLTAAAIDSAARRPPALSRMGKKKTPTKPPSLPVAEAIPWPVVRPATGKSSAGYTKVVALGPNSVKK